MQRSYAIYQQNKKILHKLLLPIIHNRCIVTLPFGSSSNKKLHFSEKRTLGYSMEQMYNVVIDVEQYPLFVPWCKESTIVAKNGDAFKCRLKIGYSPFVERYNSLVTSKRPHFVKAECTDGILFNQLLTYWRFSEASSDRHDFCRLHFSTVFEFKSLVHSRVASAFFDEVAKHMVNAFLGRAKQLYGPQTQIPPS